jgi:hypothetical protein
MGTICLVYTSSQYDESEKEPAGPLAPCKTPRRISASWCGASAAVGRNRSPVRGREEVVVVAAEEFRRLKGDRTGAALIAALQESPYRDIDLEPRRERLPVRDVKL